MHDRSGKGWGALISIVLFIPIFFFSGHVACFFLVSQLLVLMWSLRHNDWSVCHLSLLLSSFTLFYVLPNVKGWPWTTLAPLILYFAVIFCFPVLRKSANWFRRGRMSTGIWAAVGGIAVLSSVSLWGWYKFALPDLTWQVDLVPHLSLLPLLAAGAAFSLFNAAMEETMFRGVIFWALRNQNWPVRLVVFLQAASFGVSHIHGVPNGASGIVLAFIYGLLLGWLRSRSEGLQAPFVAHVVADLVIFVILVTQRNALS